MEFSKPTWKCFEDPKEQWQEWRAQAAQLSTRELRARIAMLEIRST